MSYSNIHNYYEQLVFSEINQQPGMDKDENFAEDVACVALNHLPARYVRHDVDMAFYLTSKERNKIRAEVAKAVKNAAKFVTSHRDEHKV